MHRINSLPFSRSWMCQIKITCILIFFCLVFFLHCFLTTYCCIYILMVQCDFRVSPWPGASFIKISFCMSKNNKLSHDLKFLHVPAGAQLLEMQIRGFAQHHQAWVDSMDHRLTCMHRRIWNWNELNFGVWRNEVRGLVTGCVHVWHFFFAHPALPSH